MVLHSCATAQGDEASKAPLSTRTRASSSVRLKTVTALFCVRSRFTIAVPRTPVPIQPILSMNLSFYALQRENFPHTCYRTFNLACMTTEHNSGENGLHGPDRSAHSLISIDNHFDTEIIQLLCCCRPIRRWDHRNRHNARPVLHKLSDFFSSAGL